MFLFWVTLLGVVGTCLWYFSKRYKFSMKLVLYYWCVNIVHYLIFLINFYTKDPIVNLSIYTFCLRHIATRLLGIKYILKNVHNLPQEGPYVMIANHPTRFDILGLSFLVPLIKKAKIIGADFLIKKYFWYGLAAPLCSIIHLPMQNTKVAIKMLDEIALAAKSDKSVIHIRPEGPTFEDKTIHEFKKGAFHLAVKHKFTIVPVVYSGYYFLDFEAKKFDDGVVYINVLPPIATNNLGAGDVNDIVAKTRHLISEEFEKLNNNF